MKVVEIQNNRNHLNTGSTAKKLSDVDINKIRAQGSGKLWLRCASTDAFLDEKKTPFNSLASGSSMINSCSAHAAGPFKNSPNNWGDHKSIDCWAMGIKIMYQHDGVNGCYDPSGHGRTGTLYVECPKTGEPQGPHARTTFLCTTWITVWSLCTRSKYSRQQGRFRLHVKQEVWRMRGRLRS